MTSSDHDPTPEQIAQALWPNYPDTVLTCLHHNEHAAVGTVIMCADHLLSGLMCEPCLLTHVGLKHTADSDVPQACSLCQAVISAEQSSQAVWLAEQLGVKTMRSAHDVISLMHPTVQVLLTGHDKTKGIMDAFYQGPIRLWGNAWLCDRCRAETPPDTVIAWEISPAGVANSPDEN